MPNKEFSTPNILGFYPRIFYFAQSVYYPVPNAAKKLSKTIEKLIKVCYTVLK